MSKNDSRTADLPRLARRRFFQSATCGAMSSATFWSTLMHFHATNAVLADGPAVPPSGDYKALVCLFLRDGMDSFNALAPYGTAANDSHYAEYLATRTGAALKRSPAWDGSWQGNDYGYLLPIADSTAIGGSGRTFGLHPRFVHLRSIYEAGDATFVANCGSLVEPLSNNSEFNDLARLKPTGLFSHDDQQRAWQTALPQSRTQINGWAGRMADLMTDSALTAAQSNVYTTIATNGQSLLLGGDRIIPYAVSPDGVTVLEGTNSTDFAYDRIYGGMQANLTSQVYANVFERTIRDQRVRARDAAAVFQQAFATAELGGSTHFPFPNSGLGNSLKSVAKSIKVAQHSTAPLRQQRQIYMVVFAGWDHHAQLLFHQDYMTRELDNGLKAFYEFLKAENLFDNVTTFTVSDFGRTLSYNGSGSDHGWGGNMIVMGGAVNASAGTNRIWGRYPDRLNDTSGSGLDAGRGTLIPQISSDAYHAELCRWFGIPNNDYLETVLPNIRNFYAAGASSHPVGFLQY